MENETVSTVAEINVDKVRDDVLAGPANPADVKRERKNALSAAVKDPVKEQPIDELATDEEPPIYDPASAKRERKDALPSANVDPVENRPEPLIAATAVHQSHDQYDVASIVRDAPDGAIIKHRDTGDAERIFIASVKAGKDFKVVHKPNQESRIMWRIPG